ncbi:MAG TPA: hypothetical protein VFW40_11425 [Capsulimonadaceae bacterium]|nr:hypothetical protein [Capsulimonadaceae bacterium]
MPESISTYLDEKVAEYRILAAPLERAAQEMEYARQLLRARTESEIAEDVPALGALSEILDISLLDLLMAPDRYGYVQRAMAHAGLTSEDVLQQLRALGPPPAREELDALGLAG